MSKCSFRGLFLTLTSSSLGLLPQGAGESVSGLGEWVLFAITQYKKKLLYIIINVNNIL